MVASPCRSEPSGTSIGDGPNPPSASWEMGIGLWQRASQSLMHVFWEAEGRTNRLVRSDHGDGRPGPDRPAAPCLGWRQRWHQLSAMAANSPSTLSLLLRRLWHQTKLGERGAPAFRFAVDDGWLRRSAKQNKSLPRRTARSSIASPEQCCHDNSASPGSESPDAVLPPTPLPGPGTSRPERP